MEQVCVEDVGGVMSGLDAEHRLSDLVFIHFAK